MKQNVIHILAAFAAAALLSACGEKSLNVETPKAVSAKGEELLQSAHLSRIFAPKLNNVEIYDGKKIYKKSGSASFELYYSVTPLYAFKNESSNYAGDFYVVDATYSLASDKMYFGTQSVEYQSQWGVGKTDVRGFFLRSYQVDISIVDSNGAEVASLFQKAPIPSTTIGSTTYTSGVTWDFNAALSGGIKDGNLTSDAGFSYNSSSTRSVKDVSITNLSNSAGKVSYKLEIKNLPKDSYHGSVPEVAINTLDFHSGWVWQIDNTAENDTATQYRMKVMVKDLIYGANSDEKHTKFPIPDQTFYIDLPIPNRVASGTVVLTNTVKDKYMTDVRFTDAKGKVFADNSGSVYGKEKYYTASLPEGNYTLSFKLDGKEYSSGAAEIAVKRAEELPLASGYYVND
jgi:hypothetical protein